MVNVRIGMWETNSSSAHQLVVSRQKTTWGPVEVPEVVDFRRADDYYFGRQVRVYTDTESKLMYTFHTMNDLCSRPHSEEAWVQGKKNMGIFFQRLRDFGVQEILLPPEGKRYFHSATPSYARDYWGGMLYETDLGSGVDHTHENYELYGLVLDDSGAAILREFLFGAGKIISADEDTGPWDSFYLSDSPRYITICSHGVIDSDIEGDEPDFHNGTSGNTHAYRIPKHKKPKVKRGRRLAL